MPCRLGLPCLPVLDLEKIGSRVPNCWRKHSRDANFSYMVQRLRVFLETSRQLLQSRSGSARVVGEPSAIKDESLNVCDLDHDSQLLSVVSQHSELFPLRHEPTMCICDNARKASRYDREKHESHTSGIGLHWGVCHAPHLNEFSTGPARTRTSCRNACPVSMAPRALCMLSAKTDWLPSRQVSVPDAERHSGPVSMVDPAELSEESPLKESVTLKLASGSFLCFTSPS